MQMFGDCAELALPLSDCGTLESWLYLSPGDQALYLSWTVQWSWPWWQGLQ